jgi:outer membrane protein OmpA-like peptidoglycan-associated protein
MNAARPLAITVALLGMACGPKRMPEPIEAGQALIVLLADPESDKVGHATIWNRSGSADLVRERDAVPVLSNRRPGPVTRISRDDVERLFGAALAALPPEPRSFTLHFKFESDELTDESARLLPAVLSAVKNRPDPEVSVVGHTDTLGPAKANIELGTKRALFVRRLLIETGLDAKTIEVLSHGEAVPLVPTPDETPEPRNRRVEITVR